MITLTKEIVNAIKQCLKEDFVNENDFSKKVNVRQATLNAWKNKKVRSIQNDKWERLYPVIKKYLPGNHNSFNSESFSVSGIRYNMNNSDQQYIVKKIINAITENYNLSNDDKIRLISIVNNLDL